MSGSAPLGREVALASALTFLFVPGIRPERFDKAASAADVAVIDLEDAVGAGSKAEARDHVRRALDRPASLFVVRINGTGTDWCAADLDALSGAPGLQAVMLARTETVADCDAVAARIPGDVPVIALIESALGVANAVEVAAHPRVVRLAFGSIDFALDIGAKEAWEPLLLARSALVQASRLGKIAAPVDGVTVAIDNAAVVGEDMRRAKALGFGAKLCIHPNQVAPVAAALSPTEEEVRWARRMLDAVGSDADATAVDGTMVDRPVLERARRILQQQDAAGAAIATECHPHAATRTRPAAR